MKRLISSLRYWNVRLRNAQKNLNVIITLYNGDSKVYPKLQSIVDALFVLNKDIEITGYAKFKNKRFLSVSFDSEEARDFVALNLRNINNFKVAYLHWVDEEILDTITVDWLSDITELDLTIGLIEQYMNINLIKKETTILENGKECVSGRVVCKGRLIENVVIDEIPHFSVIDGLEVLIIVEGRPCKCFTCFKLGHKAAQCLKAYCKQCKKVLAKIHLCQRLEGEVAVVNEKIQNYVFLDQEEAVVEENTARLKDRFGMQSRQSDGHQNLFQNNVLLFPEGNLFPSNEQVFVPNCEQVLTQNVTQFSGTVLKMRKGTEQSGHLNWFSDHYNSQDRVKSEANSYITDEKSKGDPNFVLIDTSSEESDGDSSDNQQIFGRAEECMNELVKCTEISRSLTKDALTFLDLSPGKKRVSKEDEHFSDLKLLKQDSENIQLGNTKLSDSDKDLENFSMNCVNRTNFRGKKRGRRKTNF